MLNVVGLAESQKIFKIQKKEIKFTKFRSYCLDFFGKEKINNWLLRVGYSVII